MRWINPVIFASKPYKICRALNRFLNNCDIEDVIPNTTIFHHSGNGVVIARGTKLGENVEIFQNVTIGKEIYKVKGFPTIKDNVILLPNCVIVGEITIGENSIIGSGTYIDKDILPNSFVHNKQELVIKKIVEKKQ